MRRESENGAQTTRPAILKDLCFLTGVLCPLLALILCFVVKDEVYAKTFRVSMIYCFALWVVGGLIAGLNRCDADLSGISKVKGGR